MSVTFKLNQNRKMKNCIFEKQKFPMEFISFRLVSKKTQFNL